MRACKLEIVAVYAAAFAQPPYARDARRVAAFGGTLAHHTAREAFSGWVARDRPGGRIIGFTYAYHTAPGGWWHEQVAAGLGPRTRRTWLDGACEFVELAVEPAYQGRGLGTRLHDTLLAGRTERTAVLSTMDIDTPALHLYRKRGWVTLLRSFRFSTDVATWLILGLDLRRFQKEFQP